MIPLSISNEGLVELCATWEGLIYAVYKLWASQIWMEGDSIRWLSNPPSDDSRWYPLLLDCWRMLRSLITFDVSHVFQDANSVAKWMASFVAEYSGSILWDSTATLPVQFIDILLFDSRRCIYSYLV